MPLAYAEGIVAFLQQHLTEHASIEGQDAVVAGVTGRELGKEGVKDVLISPGRVNPAKTFEFLTQTRRAALKKKFRPLGCPVLVLADADDPAMSALDACGYVCKYAGVVVTNPWDPTALVTILTARQSIYTDPQRPVQVEPTLHEIGEVTPQSPVLVTTNFSLSYYSVESQVESSRVPCYILAVDTEGTSVLTSWPVTPCALGDSMPKALQ